MATLKHELKQSRIMWIIWTVAILSLMMVCIFLFPEMKKEMDEISKIFASMGSFSKAFGMDQLNFGTLLGFYSVECGNIMGLGGAFFACLCGINALAKEEKGHTAEFLLTHPVSRFHIVVEKLVAVLLQIVVMNLLIFGGILLCIAFIGEVIPWKELILLHLAYFLLQIELAGICFGISAFIRKQGLGIGLGLAVLMYFLNLIANISDQAQFLNWITPFGYADGSEIINELALNIPMISLGLGIALIAVLLGFYKYTRKDIAA